MKNTYIPIIAGILLFLSVFNANAETSLFLIVDSSTAMRDKIDGESKINILKKGLIPFFESMNEPISVGMIIYGNTKSKGCDVPFNDLSLRLMDGKNQNGHLRVIRNLKPQGEIPLSKALIQAIRTLGATNGKRVIIVIGSGEDTCSFYPCEDVERVLKNSKNISVNTIGMGIDDDTAKSHLNCLARVGNGLFFNAWSVDDVKNGLTQVVKEASSNLKVYVTVSRGKPFTGTINAGLFHLNETFPYQDYTGHPVFFSVTPGPYRLVLECSDNHMNLYREINGIEIPETGEKTIQVDLDMGMIDIDLTLAEDRKLPQHMVTQIFRTGNHEEIVGESKAVPFTYYLPAGTYDFRMDMNHFGYQKSIWMNQITVKSGKITYESLNLILGKLKLTVYESQYAVYSGPLKISVYSSDDHDMEILSTTAHPALLYLPQGLYDICVRLDNEIYKGAHWKKNVPVATGDTTLEFMNLGLGEIAVTIHAVGENVAGGLTKLQIFPSGSTETPILETDQNPFNTLLPAGRYDISIEFTGGVEKIRKFETNILVIPGKTIEKIIDLELKAFEVHFYSTDATDVSDFVTTTLFRSGNEKKELLINQKGSLNILLPVGIYDLKFELFYFEKRKIYWKRNVQITSDPVQSFNVTFPNEDFESH